MDRDHRGGLTVSRAFSTLMIVAVALMSAACGGESGSGDGPGGSRGGSAYSDKRACDLLTLDDAKVLIGPDAEKGEQFIGDQESPTIVLSQCLYHDAEVDHTVHLLLRAPRTDEGAKENERVFDNERPDGAQDVSGYGDKAYFDPKAGQLTVYARGAYMIFNNGVGMDDSKKTLADARKVADVVLPRM
jgi:hypothetical protein